MDGTRNRPPAAARVTLVLVFLNAVAFAALVAANGGAMALRPDVLAAGGANVGALTSHGEWWRLLTATFLHLGLAHLVLNLWALWSLGPTVERLLGAPLYAALYLATGVLASLGSVAWDPSRTSVGASGAIFGICGALLAGLARRGKDVPVVARREQWIGASVFVVVSLAAGVLVPSIDNAAHVTGLCAGFGLGWLAVPPLGGDARGTRCRARVAAAAVLVLVALAGGAFYVRAPEPRADSLYAFWDDHPWYAAGESETLRAWERLADRAQKGRVSRAEFATALEREVLPFWQQAHERLDAERRASPAAPAASSFRARVLELAGLRRDLARAQVAAARQAGDPGLVPPLARAAMLAQARIEYVTLRESVEAQARGLAGSYPVHRLLALVSTRGRCVRPPAGAVPGLPGPADSRTDAPALRLQASCEAQRLLLAGRYRELDELLAQQAAHLNDLPDGESSVTGSYAGFEFLFAGGRLDARRALARISDWRRAVPGSVEPELVESQALRAWARSAQPADGPTTSPEAQFRHEMANEALRRVQQAGAGHPVWHTLSVIGALDDPDALRTARASFDAGAARFPTYYPLYYAMLRILLPRERGSFEPVARFVDEVTAGTPAGERAPLYSRLYAHVAILAGDDADLFADTPANWRVMEEGFRRLVARHPGSDYLLNTFANLACRRGDAATYLSLRPLIAVRPSAAAWHGEVRVEGCDEKIQKGAGDAATLRGDRYGAASSSWR